jgi:hypothetical protein
MSQMLNGVIISGVGNCNCRRWVVYIVVRHGYNSLAEKIITFNTNKNSNIFIFDWLEYLSIQHLENKFQGGWELDKHFIIPLTGGGGTISQNITDDSRELSITQWCKLTNDRLSSQYCSLQMPTGTIVKYKRTYDSCFQYYEKRDGYFYIFEDLFASLPMGDSFVSKCLSIKSQYEFVNDFGVLRISFSGPNFNKIKQNVNNQNLLSKILIHNGLKPDNEVNRISFYVQIQLEPAKFNWRAGSKLYQSYKNIGEIYSQSLKQSFSSEFIANQIYSNIKLRRYDE